jgi:hypothetical protein
LTFTLLSTMAFTTPSVKAAIWTGITPAAAAFPAALRLAALMVDDTSAVGMHADAGFGTSPTPRDPPDSKTPCLASRFVSIALARASRLATVPSGRPS